jgi:hypothetical protein
MAHVWQHHFGKSSRGNYHNKQWADKMQAIGLIASDTGEPGGKRTGQGMTHYIIPGGLFEQSAQKLLANSFCLNWQSVEFRSSNHKRTESKIKYTCPECSLNAWGKPGLILLCGLCSEPDSLVAMEAGL